MLSVSPSDSLAYHRYTVLRMRKTTCRANFPKKGQKEEPVIVKSTKASAEILRWMQHYFVDKTPQEALGYRDLELSFQVDCPLHLP